MSSRRYLIICLKRSEYPENKVYWRPNRAGYTKYIPEAGLYTGKELDDCAGSNGDWIVEPVWPSKWADLRE
jgi:hypothetical protein